MDSWICQVFQILRLEERLKATPHCDQENVS